MAEKKTREAEPLATALQKKISTDRNQKSEGQPPPIERASD
jgi:hypothetical protein